MSTKYRIHEKEFSLLQNLAKKQKRETEIRIEWFRLMVGGKTCPRCTQTENEIEQSFLTIKNLAELLNIKITLEKHELSEDTFFKNPSDSNMILINKRPIEKILGGEVGASKCCDVCGDRDCRTLILNNSSFEVVTKEIFIKAVLMEMLDKIKY
jgi:hypothetical protein